MANKTVKIRKPGKKSKKSKEPNILERLKKLSDDAPVVQLRGGSFAFYDDNEAEKFKDKF